MLGKLHASNRKEKVKDHEVIERPVKREREREREL